MSLFAALTDSVWEGEADLSIDGGRVQLGRWPVHWNPRTLAFSFEFSASSPAFVKLMTMDWQSDVAVRLANVRLAHGTWFLSAAEVVGCRTNAIGDWLEEAGFDPDDWSEEDRCKPPEMRQLCVGVTGMQAISFVCEGPKESYSHSVWWRNWPAAMWLPSSLELAPVVSGRVILDATSSAHPCVLALHATDPAIRDVVKRLEAALALACGAPIRRRAARFENKLRVYREIEHGSPSQLPMFRDVQSRAPIAQMLVVAAQWREADEERLRSAAELTVLGKISGTPLEIRYLLLMMCVEMVDGNESLSKNSIAEVLAIAPNEAELLKGMRDMLLHGHHGGGHRRAFKAWLAKRTSHRQGLPVLGPLWQHTLDTGGPTLHFDRLFFQLCERVDAFWCRELQVTSDLQSCRNHMRHFSALGAMYLDSARRGYRSDRYLQQGASAS
jgi:hypothetical protein